MFCEEHGVWLKGPAPSKTLNNWDDLGDMFLDAFFLFPPWQGENCFGRYLPGLKSSPGSMIDYEFHIWWELGLHPFFLDSKMQRKFGCLDIWISKNTWRHQKKRLINLIFGYPKITIKGVTFFHSCLSSWKISGSLATIWNLVWGGLGRETGVIPVCWGVGVLTCASGSKKNRIKWGV